MKSTDDLVGLVEAWVIDVVRRSSLRESVFFLCVAYDGDEADSFPRPMPAVGLDSERREGDFAKRLLATIEKWKEKGDGLKADWYNPANYANYEVPTMGALEKPSFLADPKALHLVSDWYSFYVEVARRLSSHDWSDCLQTTDDFVVFATDIHMDKWEESFRANVAPGLRRRLWEGGWVPKSVVD